MLSRVADRLYWTARYLERAENTARLVNAYSHLILDIPRGAEPGWNVLIEIFDAQPAFNGRYKNLVERNVVKFLLADTDNVSSIRYSVRMARENVRTTRDVLPTQTWELVNELYLLVEEQSKQAVARQHRFEFLEDLIARNQQIHGLIEGSLLRDAGLGFLSMGQLLERADMTTRIVDVGAAIIIERARQAFPEVPLLWANLLQSLSATSAYRRKVGPTLEPNPLVDFLFADTQFPRSVLYCVNHIEEIVGQLKGPAGLLRAVRRCAAKLQKLSTEKLTIAELHELIDELQLALAEINDGIGHVWFTLDAE